MDAGYHDYRIGDHDDTPPYDRDQCSGSGPDGFICTRPTGHMSAQHAAGNGDTIVDVWDDRDHRPKESNRGLFF